jgi:hypothetical protein
MGNVVEDVPPVNLFEILLRTNGGEGVQGASVGIQGLLFPGIIVIAESTWVLAREGRIGSTAGSTEFYLP